MVLKVEVILFNVYLMQKNNNKSMKLVVKKKVKIKKIYFTNSIQLRT